MNKNINIICVTQGPEIPARVRQLVGPAARQVVREKNVDRLLERFESESFDLLILSSAACRAEEAVGLGALELIAAKSPATRVIFLVREDEIDMAVSALKAGTFHYLREPVSDEELKLVMEAALTQRPHNAPNLLLRKGNDPAGYMKMIGRSEAMQEVYDQIRRAADSDVPVLISGETGTGKDLAAQAIHRSSARKEHVYLPVNLGALPPELVASELFGHEKGSFTGAGERRQGIFERGDPGTVFLDEISTIDEKVQVSLLRLIEQKRFHRLGGRTWVKTNARMIAASNEDLLGLVENGSFREDLYYRLDVFHIIMPPLRSRQGDLQLLIDGFLGRYAASLQKAVTGISPDCMRILEEYAWPGNVRELKNVIQRGILVAQGSRIEPHDLPPRLTPERDRNDRLSFRVGTPLQQVERRMIEVTLEVTGNNRTRAAELLGISRRALYNKIHRYGIGGKV